MATTKTGLSMAADIDTERRTYRICQNCTKLDCGDSVFVKCIALCVCVCACASHDQAGERLF